MSDDLGNFLHNSPPEDDEPVAPNGLDPLGWVAIHRGIVTHWLVGFGQNVRPADPSRGSYNCGEAFLFLILAAKYRDGWVNNGGRKMMVKRGQLVGATSWLAAIWNWTPKTVRGFLDRLEADGMITRQVGTDEDQQKGKHRGKQAQVLTIRKYSEFQDVRVQQGQTEGKQRANEGQTTGNIYMEEQGKQGKQRNNSNAASACASDPPEKASAAGPHSPRLDFDELQAKLYAAGDGALASPAVAPGLLTLAEPINWLEAGADLERDILPAIVELTARHKLRARARPIASWTYFANRVAELRAARLAGLPTLALDAVGPTGIRGKSKFEALQEAADRINARSARP